MHKSQIIKTICIFTVSLILGCSSIKQQPKDTFASEVLRNARKIIYVSPEGNDKAFGSRVSPLATIQKAIDTAQHGDAVKVQPGIYKENIRLRSHISLVGSGADLVTITADDGNIITAENVFDITIEGFSLDGKDNAKHGLFANCEHLQRSSKSQAPTMIIFRKNVVKNFINHGVHGEYTNITLRENSIFSIVTGGVWLSHSFSDIRNNKISLAEYGIAHTEYGSSIEENIIEDTRSEGIFCNNLRWAKIKRNRILRTFGNAIHCEAMSPIIKKNYIAFSSKNGIRCHGNKVRVSGPKIRENIIIKNRLHGVYIDKYSCPDIGRNDDFGNNLIYDNGKFAVYSESPRTIMAVGNWWGSPEPNANQFHGKIDYAESLSKEPGLK